MYGEHFVVTAKVIATHTLTPKSIKTDASFKREKSANVFPHSFLRQLLAMLSNVN